MTWYFEKNSSIYCITNINIMNYKILLKLEFDTPSPLRIVYDECYVQFDVSIQYIIWYYYIGVTIVT